MKHFAVSVMVIRRDGPGEHSVRHTAFVVEAVSQDEAVGKGMAIGRKLYPGWDRHDVVVGDSVPVTLETATLLS